MAELKTKSKQTIAIERIKENTPTMIAADRWCLYRLVEKGGKVTKKPYQAKRPTVGASSTDPKTWATFEEAAANAEKADGVGFMLGDGWQLFDADDCIDTKQRGKVSNEAAVLVLRINSYTQYSQSWNGLHCIFRGPRKPGKRCKKGAFEYYDSERFVAMTGAVYGDQKEIRELSQAEIDDLYFAIFENDPLIKKAMSAKNGRRFTNLWKGNISEYASDSEADYALINELIFWCGGDGDQVKKYLLKSGLRRNKWETLRGDVTYLEYSIDRALEKYTGEYYASSVNGQPGKKAKKTKRGRPRRPMADYYASLKSGGFTPSLNVMNDQVYINNKRLTDVVEAALMAHMHDQGFHTESKVRTAIMSLAGKTPFHPIREYLESVKWDGANHLEKLLDHFEFDPEYQEPYRTFFTRFLVGVVAKVYGQTTNFCLVLSSEFQGIGKSYWANWLCPNPEWFVESEIDLKYKQDDSKMKSVSSLIWEVGELQSTYRKADRASLKFFLTNRSQMFRPPYGRRPINKPVTASYIGTLNNEMTGWLDDPTGNRRFVITEIDSVDWDYTKNVDRDQLWAQLYQLWKDGEPYDLTPDEQSLRDALNERHEVEPVEVSYFQRAWKVDHDEGGFVPTADVINRMKSAGFVGNIRTAQMVLGEHARRLGMTGVRKYHQGSQKMGYEPLLPIGNFDDQQRVTPS